MSQLRVVFAFATAAFAYTLAVTTTAAPGGQVRLAAGQAGAVQTLSGYVGSDTCLGCHDDKQGMAGTIHGKAAHPRSPEAAQGCETCHGPGQPHAESGDPDLIRSFTAIPAREASATCTSCHNRGVHSQWSGSMHDTRNLSCVTCHSVHSPQSETAQLKTSSEIETCAQCHKAQVLKVQRVAHMPVREGKMTCTSCHNPHGSTNIRLLKVGNWVNESCVSCHTEKRGPFLWEHAAGRESCISCHDPHGSSNDRMLIAKLPMLCQRCHIGTRHPSTIYDNLAVQNGSNRIIGRGCVNCHAQIHGSNHPSGSTFLR
ncbi:MAG: DmsE family decaheme c-type cytochrome [Acidobacteria bacterium]|nr:DmsE family decaheme c-type cytochrome [Acidobacteriota bacterium]